MNPKSNILLITWFIYFLLLVLCFYSAVSNASVKVWRIATDVLSVTMLLIMWISYILTFLVGISFGEWCKLMKFFFLCHSPAFTLFICASVNELILKQKQRSEEKRLKLDHPVSKHLCLWYVLLLLFWLKIPCAPQNGSRWQVFQDVLTPDQENLDLANVNLMLELLVQKKKQLEAVRNGGEGFELWGE